MLRELLSIKYLLYASQLINHEKIVQNCQALCKKRSIHFLCSKLDTERVLTTKIKKVMKALQILYLGM